MSNRQKLKKRKSIFPRKVMKEALMDKIELPTGEKVVHKTVPAKARGEVIGEAVIYEDGSIDIITFKSITPQQQQDIEELKAFMEGTDEGVTYA